MGAGTRKVEIRRDGDGKRYIRPYLGVNKVTGRPKRPYKSFPDSMTDEECREAAEAWYVKLTNPGSMSVYDALDLYIDRGEKLMWASNTIRTYRNLVKLLGSFGNMSISEVRPKDVSKLYKALIKRKGLSRSTVALLHGFLRAAWKYFCDELEATDANIMLSVGRPKPERRDTQPLNEDDYAKLRAIINARGAEGTTPLRRCTLVASLIALMCGLRAGEACALRRRDVNLYTGNMRVGATISEGTGKAVYQPRTKNKKTRNLRIAPELAEALKEHFAWQDSAIEGTDSRTPIVSFTGEYIRPSAISRDFKAIARAKGFENGVRFHSLRHTHATYELGEGIDVRTISERIGHSDPATTLRYYTHAIPARDEAAAEASSRIWERMT